MSAQVRARTGPASQLERVLHPRAPESAPWRWLPLVLALAFAVRAGVALSGDFVLHPDEIMQYLEPAHRLVFGSGVTYWEYFYGARSWLVPGLVAAVLALFDALGLGEPRWYVAGVKLAFCAISLAIPAGMYFFARGHFGEATARAALVAGAFWYELAGFAHKPLTELVATAPLMALLALTVRPAGAARTQAVWQLDRGHHQLPGYYYLHRAIPFYDAQMRSVIERSGADVTALASHLVTGEPALPVSGYSVERTFGAVRILRRDVDAPPVRRWRAYAPVLVDDLEVGIMRRIDPQAPLPPANWNIRLTGPPPPATRTDVRP
ncbi:MAG: hypothetical protein OXI15_22630 [Chromatiales bacterium]|nr:hypothetical protein [Chromatiales bacterium]